MCVQGHSPSGAVRGKAPQKPHKCSKCWWIGINFDYSVHTDSRLEVLREHRPPPNASIIKLWQFFPDPDSDADRHQNVISWSLGHTPTLHKISSTSVGNFFDNPVNPDFGLLDPGGDPDCHQNWTHWSLGHALPLQGISSKSVHKFLSYPTDRQTNRPKWKHNLLRRR